jgi:hypothetical protein
MKRLLSLLPTSLLLVPGVVSAQGFVTCTGLDCSACNLVEMGQLILFWLIGILAVVFAAVALAAGWGLVTSGGNQQALSQAKSKLANAFIGFLIVLAAWLIIDVLMRSLLAGTGGEIPGYGPWNRVECGDMTEPDFVAVTLAEDSAQIAAGLATTSVAVGPPGPNCGFNEALLVPIPGEGSHRAVASVASTYVSMRSAAAALGVNLSVTSSYRSDARQTQLWDQCPSCQSAGTVARPCSRGGNGSRHSSGVALDISSAGGRPERCAIVDRCRAAGASFIMMYGGSNHVHCDWGSTTGEVNVSCP